MNARQVYLKVLDHPVLESGLPSVHDSLTVCYYNIVL